MDTVLSLLISGIIAFGVWIVAGTLAAPLTLRIEFSFAKDTGEKAANRRLLRIS